MSEFPREHFPEKVPRNTAAKFIAAGVCLAFSVLLFILVWCAHASVLMAFSAMFLCAAAAPKRRAAAFFVRRQPA